MKTYRTKKGEEVFLDDEDYQYLIIECEYRYYPHKNKFGKFGNVCRKIPARLSDTGKQKEQCIHWDVIGHPNEGFVTDHIDGNPLNNQKSNLRICSHRENMRNLRHKSNTRNYSSKYPGVSWHKRVGKWNAQIRVNKSLKHLGYFLNEEDAAHVYQNACKIIKTEKK